MAGLRLRRKRHHPPDPSMTPMMNLMVVLIPLLLSSAEFVRIGMVELNLPPATAGRKAGEVSNLPLETLPKLELTVIITDRGFFISSAMAVLRDRSGEPTIPKKEGAYDFDGLSAMLYQIKQKATGRFPDTDQIILLAEPQIDYQTLISTMDAARLYRGPEGDEVLFPQVALSVGLF